MSAAPDRDQEILSDLAERAYALACKVQDQAMAAEEPETLRRLTGDFDRAVRCVRQVVGLKARLKRDAERQDRDHQAEAVREVKAGVAARRAQVSATVRRVIGEQYRGYDARELREDLEARLDEEALYDDFTAETVEVHIERLCDELGLAKDGEEPPPRGPPLDPRIAELLARIPDETEDAEDENEASDAPSVSPSGGKRREGPQGRVADGGGVEDIPPAEDDPQTTPPIGHSAEPAERAPSDPDPPPKPPDPPPPAPEPYLMPWERGRPDRGPPGGSWMR